MVTCEQCGRKCHLVMVTCEQCGRKLATLTLTNGRYEYTIVIDPCWVRRDGFEFALCAKRIREHRAVHGHGEFAIAVEGERTDHVMGFVARLEAAIPDARFMEGQELESFLLASAVLAT